MNGPAHFREGEERMRASDYQRQQAGDDGDLTTALHEAAMAQAHFLALTKMGRSVHGRHLSS